MKDTFYLGFFLAVCCAVAAGMIAFTYVSTLPRINAHQAVAAMQAIKVMMPGADRLEEVEPGYFVGYRGTVEVGQCQDVTTRGYGGDIEMLVGIDENEKVTAVKILKMAETPGRGMKANDPKFLGQFIGKGSAEAFKANGDIQAITGATITTQAVCDGVKKALTELTGSREPN